VKKLRRKTLAQDVSDGICSLDGVKTLINISVQNLNSVDLCSGVGIVWSTTAESDSNGFTDSCFVPKHESVKPLLSLILLNV